MYDPSLKWPVLSLLDRWGRLPLSDVECLLDPLDRVRFRKELAEALAAEGLALLRPAGDELVLELTPLGRSRLAARGRPHNRKEAEGLDE